MSVANQAGRVLILGGIYLIIRAALILCNSFNFKGTLYFSWALDDWGYR